MTIGLINRPKRFLQLILNDLQRFNDNAGVCLLHMTDREQRGDLEMVTWTKESFMS